MISTTEVTPWSATHLLLDACTVLNLFASRRMREILGAQALPAGVVEAVHREARYVYKGGAGDDARERERVDLAPLTAAGLLRLFTPNDAELAEFINLTLRIKGDGEAMTISVAIARGWPIVTDDRKAIRLIAGRTGIRSSLDLIKTWADDSSPGDDILRGVLVDIRTRGNYSPSRDHPFRSWWDSIMAEP